MNSRLAEAFGYAKAGDGGGGTFQYDATSVAPDNGGTIIAPKSNVGRWHRVHDGGQIDTRWFGSDLKAAYAALPVTGGIISLGADLVISTPETLTINKPLILDLGGHRIIIATASGPGLSIMSGYSNRATPIQIKNGIIKRSGAGAVTGVYMKYALYLSMSNLQFLNFEADGSVALLWDFVEDSVIEKVEFNNNATGLVLHNNSNQNEFNSVWFQGNKRALYIHSGSDLNSFRSCLFQSNTGTHTIEIVGDTADVYLTRFKDCWFELNGDGTPNTREVYQFADAPRRAFGTIFEGNNFSPTNRGGTTHEFAGTGEVQYNTFIGNSYSTDPIGNRPGQHTVVEAGTITVKGGKSNLDHIRSIGDAELANVKIGAKGGALLLVKAFDFTMSDQTIAGGGNSFDWTIAVDGVEVGDAVSFSRNDGRHLHDGVIYQAYVRSPGVVHFRATNMNATPAALGNVPVRAVIIR